MAAQQEKEATVPPFAADWARIGLDLAVHGAFHGGVALVLAILVFASRA